MRAQPKAPSEVFGPFESVALRGADVVQFLTLPYEAVINSVAIVSILSDNSRSLVIGQNQFDASLWYGIWHAEVAIYGSVQGYETLLKRQHLRYNYGPAMMRFGAEDVFDQVVFKARFFCGGKPGFPQNIIFATSEPPSLPIGVNVCRRRL